MDPGYCEALARASVATFWLVVVVIGILLASCGGCGFIVGRMF